MTSAKLLYKYGMMVVTIILWCLSYLNFTFEEISIPQYDNDKLPTSKTISSSAFHVCPNTLHLFRDMPSIEAAYNDAEAFHKLGGNLKSVETYLNTQIDETIKVQGLEFKPYDDADGSLPPNTTIAKWVKDLLVAKDLNKRGGYDQRSGPGLLKYPVNDNNNKILRGGKKQRFDVMEPVDGFQRWKAAMGPIHDICKELSKIEGEHKYDDKYMCSFEDLKIEKNSSFSSSVVGDTVKENDYEENTNGECGIISIGNNGQWGFERTISDATACTTHTFDCTVANPRKPDDDSINFYPYCVADEHKMIEDREFLTYSQLLEKASMHAAPTLFKIDVEGFEYDVMTEMLNTAKKTGSKNKLPTQISIELHYATRMYDLPWMMRHRQAGEIAMFTGMMYREGGYLPMHVEYTMGCDSCAEILFVRVFCD